MGWGDFSFCSGWVWDPFVLDKVIKSGTYKWCQGGARKTSGFRSQLSPGDVVWSWFSHPSLHGLSFCLGHTSWPYCTLACSTYWSPVAGKWSFRGSLPAYWLVLTPGLQHHVLYCMKLPCFLIHCPPLDAQRLAQGRDTVHPLADPLFDGGTLNQVLHHKNQLEAVKEHCPGNWNTCVLILAENLTSWVTVRIPLGWFLRLHLIISSSN